MKLWTSFLSLTNTKALVVLAAACCVPAISQTSTATSPEAGLTTEGGASKWKTTLLIKSAKPVWFIKSAELVGSPASRVCAEDTSKGKAASKALLGNFEIKYPMPRRANGDFDVVVTPSAGYDKGGMSKCTYNAKIKFFHGSKPYTVQNIFVFNFAPGKAPTPKTQPVVATKPKVTPSIPQKVEAKKVEVAKKVEDKKTEAIGKVDSKKAEQTAKVDAKKEDAASMIKKPLDTKMPKTVEKKEEPKKTLKVEPVKKPEVVKPEVKKEEPKKVEAPVTPKTEAPKAEVAKVETKPAETKPTAPAVGAPSEPEDLPEPENVEVSEEAKIAMVQAPKSKIPATPATGSSNYKMGMDAYAAGEMEKAITHLSTVPKPESKKRGDPQRDEYVQANYHMGMAAQKVGSLKQAIKAYQEVLEYEKYFPIVSMNLGICYVEMRQFAKANRAFRNVERDQNRIAPEQYDDIMQRTRYFWAITWTRMYRASSEPDRKDFYKRQAVSKWTEYKTWYGEMEEYAKANAKANDYLAALK